MSATDEELFEDGSDAAMCEIECRYYQAHDELRAARAEAAKTARELADALKALRAVLDAVADADECVFLSGIPSAVAARAELARIDQLLYPPADDAGQEGET